MEIPKNISKEVSDFYNTSRNTFYAKDKGEVAEEREVEIGDTYSDDFQPQVKLKQWDNETNFSVRLIDDEPDTPEIKTEGNKIKFIKNKLEAHFYNTKIGEKKETDGFEFEVLLKEKPKTNKVQMSIESKGLKFYYQPELTQEEKDDGAFRPENVIGSYAVYHESKQGDYSKMGKKNYRAGKAFHIYRPKIIDSAGTEVWGKLNITNNLLSVEIPQEFLDNAVYPVRHAAGLEFGIEEGNQGGSWSNIYTDIMRGVLFTSPADTDTANSLTAYVRFSNYGGYFKSVLVLHSNLNIVNNGLGNEKTMTGVQGAWDESTFSNSPSLTPSTEYVLSIVGKSNYLGTPQVAYDTGSANQGHYDSTNNYTTPENPTGASHSTKRYSIYCTYWDAATTESPYIPKGIPKPFRGAQIDKAHPLNRGLVGFWLMNEGDGKKVFDLSGNGNLGTLTNMAFPPTSASGWNAGRRGVGLKFDGTDDYVDCGNDGSIRFSSNNFSIAAWVKMPTSTAHRTIAGVGRHNVDEWFFYYNHSSPIYSYSFYGGNSNINLSATTDPRDNVWHHVVFVRNGSNGYIYFNGIEENSQSGITCNLSSSKALLIGKNETLGEYFNGQIDQVRIYNRALSAEEIKTLYLYPYGMFQRKDIIWIPEEAAAGIASRRLLVGVGV